MAKKAATIKPNDIEQNQFYTLSAMVWSALEDIQAGEERFNQFLHYAYEFAREYHMDMGRKVEAGEFEMKPWKQLDLPCDAVDVTIVGFKCGNMIKTFTYDRNIPKTFDKSDTNCDPVENTPCCHVNDLEVSDDKLPFFGAYGRDGLMNKYYGLAVRQNYLGYFDIDWTKRVINFKETVKGQNKVYLEWITDGVNHDGETVIHPYAFRLGKLWIHWQRKENDDRFPMGEKERAMRLYNNEVDNVLIRQMNMSIQDIKEALRSGYRQTPKN
jgi:hypothetical protein